jgi:hypothetical protein
LKSQFVIYFLYHTSISNRISKHIIPPGRIENKILFLRGLKVMLGSDLALLYSVPVRALVQAVIRNASRFPSDFMFQLTPDELKILKSQSVTSSWGGARRALPYPFTEQGVAMLSSVLRSERAVQVNIAIMRAFVQLRAMLATHEDLRRKITEMEKHYDSKFHAIFTTIRQMLAAPSAPKKEIGFHARATLPQRARWAPH